jgi:hypothetical protein
MAHGDAEGVRLIGQLADYLKLRSEGKVVVDSTLSVGGLIKALEDKIREQIAGTVRTVAPSVEALKP